MFLGSAKAILAWRTLPQAKQKTRGTLKAMKVGCLPMGSARKLRSTAPLGPNLVGAALGTTQALAGLFDAEGGDARLEVLADVAVADDAEAVIH